MLKKFWRNFRNFFTPLSTKDHAPKLDFDYDRFSPVGGLLSAARSVTETLTARITVSEQQHRRNIEKIEIAKLSQDRESINHNLKAQHRLMIATLITAVIALLSSSVAVFISINSKPPTVNIAPTPVPDVNVTIPLEKSVPEEAVSSPGQNDQTIKP